MQDSKDFIALEDKPIPQTDVSTCLMSCFIWALPGPACLIQLLCSIQAYAGLSPFL